MPCWETGTTWDQCAKAGHGVLPQRLKFLRVVAELREYNLRP